MKARKLLAKRILGRLYHRYAIGVPIAKLIRDSDLDISLPAFTNLINYYEESLDKEQSIQITNTIADSLFPEWLDPFNDYVQSQPKEWKYIGKFPVGSWSKVFNEDN